jgi:hypothetical protein
MFDIELHHVPGTKLAAPDALSCRPDHHPTDSNNEDVTLLPDTMFVRLLDDSLCDTLSTDDPSLDPIVLSTAYHPQTDRQTECLNQELEMYLQIYCRTNPETWVKHLPLAEFVHNRQNHDSCNASPFYLMMGYNP